MLVSSSVAAHLSTARQPGSLLTTVNVVENADDERLVALWLHGRPTTIKRAYSRDIRALSEFVSKPISNNHAQRFTEFQRRANGRSGHAGSNPQLRQVAVHVHDYSVFFLLRKVPQGDTPRRTTTRKSRHVTSNDTAVCSERMSARVGVVLRNHEC